MENLPPAWRFFFAPIDGTMNPLVRFRGRLLAMPVLTERASPRFCVAVTSY